MWEAFERLARTERTGSDLHFGTSSVKGLRAGGRVRGRQLGTVEFSREKEERTGR